MGIVKLSGSILSRILTSRLMDLTFTLCVMSLATITTLISMYSPKLVVWLIDKYTISLKTLAILAWIVGTTMLISTILKFIRNR